MAEEKEERREGVGLESKEKTEMKAWEQHAGVINMPRFDYNAPSALLHHSHSGFLITCSIKREKSATKEAMSILEKYAQPYNNGSYEKLESSKLNKSTKRRKIFTDEIREKRAEGAISKNIIEDTGGHSKDDCLSLAKTDATIEGGFVPSLVKLTRSGLLLLTFPKENSPDTVHIVSNIFQCLESGSLKSPLWCHRIFPIQATCHLSEKELEAVVSKLVLQFLNDKQDKLARPLKFAVGYNRRGMEETQMKIAKNTSVGYNRRGMEETQMKIAKNTSKDCDLFSLLDRSKCFDVVASAVKNVVSDSAVDLKSPELCILVELLPVSGVPNGSLVAAISVLPQNLVSVKPRLCIKPLISDANSKTGRG